MNPIDNLLPRLDKVKPNGAGKWLACCPAHDDKNPSLSVKEAEDGTVLLKCWAGCAATEITAAVSLEVRDLFSGSKQPRRGPSKAALNHERAVFEIGLSMQMQGCRMTPEDQARFELAKQRLGVGK
ncbi:virulence-associated protein E [Stutzerimonas zhaodongensis]|uniref:virulence-associated protein E n=1 Tax=Stutzerimonas zhaodongensis TaxID=1176257 RepID=UPI0021060C98|nr:virulence-associated protein E [Stutzerimonas zhaodongensis]MCQ2031960.1 virulence-associated protein E [Stutzerimonas zhaodongensis]